jgi:hypothetical protein
VCGGVGLGRVGLGVVNGGRTLVVDAVDDGAMSALGEVGIALGNIELEDVQLIIESNTTISAGKRIILTCMD